MKLYRLIERTRLVEDLFKSKKNGMCNDGEESSINQNNVTRTNQSTSIWTIQTYKRKKKIIL